MLDRRPMPSTTKPRASSAVASASPRPREMPVTMAAFRCFAVMAESTSCIVEQDLLPAAQPEHDQHDDEGDENEERDLPRALRVLAADRPGRAVHEALERA